MSHNTLQLGTHHIYTVLSLSWVSSVTAGHTKRITVNAIMLSAYCIGNSAGPFMWQAQYKPRLVHPFSHLQTPTHKVCSNHIPWIIIGICYVCCMTLLLTVRWLLARENRIRDNETPEESFEDVYIDVVNEDGTHEKVKVAKVSQFLSFAK